MIPNQKKTLKPHTFSFSTIPPADAFVFAFEIADEALAVKPLRLDRGSAREGRKEGSMEKEAGNKRIEMGLRNICLRCSFLCESLSRIGKEVDENE